MVGDEELDRVIENATCREIKEWGKRTKEGHTCGVIVEAVITERTIKSNEVRPSVAYAGYEP